MKNHTPQKQNLEGLSFFLNDLDITKTQLDLSKSPVISNKDFMLLFDISKRTAIRWRMSGKIHYVQIGRKVYYTVKEVERFIGKYGKGLEK